MTLLHSSLPTLSWWLFLFVERPENAAHHSEHGEVIRRLDFDGMLRRIGWLEYHHGSAMGQRLYRRAVSDPSGHDIAVLGLKRWRADDEISVQDGPAHHRIAVRFQREHIIRRQETTVSGDEPLSVFGKKRRLAGRNLSIVRHWLR